jgi:hypothetical protein
LGRIGGRGKWGCILRLTPSREAEPGAALLQAYVNLGIEVDYDHAYDAAQNKWKASDAAMTVACGVSSKANDALTIAREVRAKAQDALTGAHKARAKARAVMASAQLDIDKAKAACDTHYAERNGVAHARTAYYRLVRAKEESKH